MTRRAASAVALSFYALCVTAAALFMLDQVSLRPGLPGGKVAANRQQLRDLASRLRIEGGAFHHGHQLLLTFSSPCGGYSAALTDPTGQVRLGFTVDAFRPRFFADPRRPELPTVLMARHDLGSRLVPAGHRDAVEVTLSGGRGASAEPFERTARIDNVRAGLAAAQLVGRGLETLVETQHCGFAEADLRFFALLARLFETRVCADLAVLPSCEGVTILVWRDEESTTVRAGFEILAAAGRIEGSFDLRYRLGERNPYSGRWTVRGRTSTLRHPAELALTSPLPRNSTTIRLRHDPAVPIDQEADISFDQLLEGTAWTG